MTEQMWGNMNDDQRMWIIGSLMYFACNEGLTQLKGFDLSESDAKGMMAGRLAFIQSDLKKVHRYSLFAYLDQE